MTVKSLAVHSGVGTRFYDQGMAEAGESGSRPNITCWRGSFRSSSVPPSFAFNMSLSQYAIKVWVVGPVGTQPLALVL
jgi:hypothetical protein